MLFPFGATVNVFDDSFIFNESTQGNTASYMQLGEVKTSTEYLVLGFQERQQGLRVKMIPNHSNGDTAAIGSIAFGNVLSTQTVTSLTINGVELLSETFTVASTSGTELVNALVEDINAQITSPNYIATGELGILTLTAETKGTGPNGFVVAISVLKTILLSAVSLTNFMLS